MNIRQFIAKREEYLQSLIDSKKAALKTAPPGRIDINRRRDRYYYRYCLSSREGEEARYLSVKDARDQKLVREIAQRGYDEKILRLAEGEMKLITKLSRLYSGGCAEEVYDKLSEARRSLVTPIRLADGQYAEQWQAQDLRKAVIPKDVPVLETARGEKVRSKSEVFIADALFRNGLKYHYECAVEVIDHLTGEPRIVYPDFYVLNPRTRKAYYWEHFGKCDDPGYVHDNLNKLIDYQDAGIIQGVNLIITYETKLIPFSPDKAEQIIRCFLV